MDQEVASLRRSGGPRTSLGHRPAGRCPHCWMGKVRRPFQSLARSPGPPGAAARPAGSKGCLAVIAKSIWGPVRRARTHYRGGSADFAPLPGCPPAACWHDPFAPYRDGVPAPEPPAVALDREVRFGNVRYPFYVRSGPAAWEELAGLLDRLCADRFLLVTDGGLPPPSVHAVGRGLAELAPVTVLRVPQGERAKNLRTIDLLAREAFASGATRRSVFVALGGGLAGNVAGLLAHLFLRGARLVHIPTTLLAMSDSVLSLKQAVNSPVGKNHLGAFHAPELVWSQLDCLATLPPAQIRAALNEAIKNVVAICPGRYEEMAARLRPDARYTQTEFAWFIGMCVDAKQEVMATDPQEKGRALVLEYGHTVGHAAELITEGGLSHGLAIGVGGLVAARVAAILGISDLGVESAHETLLQLNGAPTFFRAGLDPDRLMRAIRLDNKRGYIPHRPGYIDMILLAGLGQPHQVGGSIITQVPEAVVRAGIQSRVGRLPASEGQQ
jgi:3-dehydroquinate synthetase